MIGMAYLGPRTVALLCTLCARQAWADDNRVLACRPTLACTADLVDPGTVEIEVGYQLHRTFDGANQHGTPFLAKLPLAHWIEVHLGSNGYTYSETASYFDDIYTGSKVHLADQTAHLPSLAVTTWVFVPTVAQRGYVRTYDLLTTAHASKDEGHFHFDLTAGLEVFQLDGPRSYQPWVAFATTYALTSKLSAALEPHYFADAAPLAARDVGAMAAVEYAARTWFVIDGALVVTGWDQGAVTAMVGVSLAPARLWRDPDPPTR